MNINKKLRIFKKPALYITWKQIYIITTVALSVIAAVAVGFAVMRFVRVGNIVVKGDNPYDRVEIMEALAVKDDDLWWTVDEKELEERLIKERPLIREVRVTKTFPNRIVVNVIEGRKPKWFIDIAGRKYTLDEELYVIEETKDTGKAAQLTLPGKRLVVKERQVPQFGESDDEIKRTVEIIYAVNNSDIRSRITALDVSNPTDITMEIDGKYVAKLGNKDDIEGKLLMIKITLDTERVKDSNGGTLFAYTYSENGYASFLPNE